MRYQLCLVVARQPAPVASGVASLRRVENSDRDELVGGERASLVEKDAVDFSRHGEAEGFRAEDARLEQRHECRVDLRMEDRWSTDLGLRVRVRVKVPCRRCPP